MKPAIDTDGTRIYLIGSLRLDEDLRQYIVMEEQWYPIAAAKPIQADHQQVLVLEGIWKQGEIELVREPTTLRPPTSNPLPRPSVLTDAATQSTLSPQQHLSELIAVLVNKMRPLPMRCPTCQNPLPTDSEHCGHCAS